MMAAARSRTIARSTGSKIERNAVVAESTSSAVLTIGLAVPALAAVTMGRAVVLAMCTVPEISRPHSMARMGCMSAMALALAAKSTAPAVGRTTVE